MANDLMTCIYSETTFAQFMDVVWYWLSNAFHFHKWL